LSRFSGAGRGGSGRSAFGGALKGAVVTPRSAGGSGRGRGGASGKGARAAGGAASGAGGIGRAAGAGGTGAIGAIGGAGCAPGAVCTFTGTPCGPYCTLSRGSGRPTAAGGALRPSRPSREIGALGGGRR
jgi:hypothetical protein